MRKTLFIIKSQGQNSENFPSLYSQLSGKEHSSFLFLHQSSHTDWSFIPHPMILKDSSKNITPSEKEKLVTYQDMLEKIFEVDVALVI